MKQHKETKMYNGFTLIANDKLKQIKAERDALAAQVENLLYVSKELSACISEYKNLPQQSVKQAMFNINNRLQPRINLTPQQSLNEIRAEAGRAGFIAGYHKMHIEFAGSLAPSGSAGMAADEYAESIRNGGE